MTSGLLAALKTIPEAERPLFLAVSGLDDLTRDERGNVDDHAQVAKHLSGFALARAISGGVLFETLTRHIAAHPTALIETGFALRYPSFRDGLPPTIEQLHFQRAKPNSSILDRRVIFLVIAAVTVGAFLAENFLSFPLSVPYMKNLAAGAPILDMRPAYTSTAVYELFDAVGV